MNHQKSRGERNNNPLNIVHGCNWKGLSKTQKDKKFCKFVNIIYGIRAAIVIMRTYFYNHNITTIGKIICRWAPPEDGNDTSAYTLFVVRMMNRKAEIHGIQLFHSASNVNEWKSPSKPPEHLFYLLQAMCIQECGYNLTEAIYNQAIDQL